MTDYIVESLRPLAEPIDDAHLDPANARMGHAIDQIAARLSLYGQRKPIVVNRSENNKIEAGNGTWQAAKLLGWAHIAMVFVEDDPMTAVGYGIADNRLGDLSAWDVGVLESLLGGLDPDLDLVTGFDDGELDALLAEMDADGGDDEPLGRRGDAEAKVDRAAELATEWGVEDGQLWRLPSRNKGMVHYLVCGDCTDAATVQRVMNGERAVLFATDPPYLVGYDGHNHPHLWGKGKSENEKVDDWAAHYKDWDKRKDEDGLYYNFILMAIFHAIAEDAAWYCWHASRRQALLEAIWERHGAFVHQQIIWSKVRPVMTRSWYLWQHEPCLFGWIRGNKPKKCSDKSGRTVWEYAAAEGAARPDHPTPKPLELFEIPMEQHTERGDICYEPFSGSGTQLIAAENLGRQCRAVEIAPAYVAVALQRYFDAFGIRAELVDGN